MSPAATTLMSTPIRPTRVRYIKLGEGGKWEGECLKGGIIRYGLDAERFSLCRRGRWDELKNLYIRRGKDKGTATRFRNEDQLFIEDDGSALWITFVGEQLHWGFLEPGVGGFPAAEDHRNKAERHPDGDSVVRAIASGWHDRDLQGELLTKDRLSGALTKLASYRGTSCNVDVAEYVVRRINGQKTPQVERAIVAVKQMKDSVMEMMGLLEPRDFETLVDLVFSSSGWRRLGTVGGTQKTLDLDLTLPSTGERAFVQVKSRTNQAGLDSYVEKIDELGPYDRMFYVYHSGKVTDPDDDRVTLVGPEKLAELVLDAGLVNWLIRKVS